MHSESFSVAVKIKQLEHAQDLPLPHYATSESAGMDLMAAVDGDVMIPARGGSALIPTGIAIALPPHVEAQVRPRSGLAVKHGISLTNSPGTIDADYRGEIKVILINHGSADFTVTRGMRIAQMVIAPVLQAHWQLTEDLDETERGTGGFGSTGVGGATPAPLKKTA